MRYLMTYEAKVNFSVEPPPVDSFWTYVRKSTLFNQKMIMQYKRQTKSPIKGDGSNFHFVTVDYTINNMKSELEREIKFEDDNSFKSRDFEKMVLNGMSKEPKSLAKNEDEKVWRGIEIIKRSTEREISNFKQQQEDRTIKADSGKFGI